MDNERDSCAVWFRLRPSDKDRQRWCRLQEIQRLQPQATLAGRGIIDTRIGKPPVFSGDGSRWRLEFQVAFPRVNQSWFSLFLFKIFVVVRRKVSHSFFCIAIKRRMIIWTLCRGGTQFSGVLVRHRSDGPCSEGILGAVSIVHLESPLAQALKSSVSCFQRSPLGGSNRCYRCRFQGGVAFWEGVLAQAKHGASLAPVGERLDSPQRRQAWCRTQLPRSCHIPHRTPDQFAHSTHRRDLEGERRIWPAIWKTRGQRCSVFEHLQPSPEANPILTPFMGGQSSG